MWFWKRTEQDFADEISAHLDIETDRLIATGMAPADARAAATRAFGNTTAAQERFHESRGLVLMEQVLQDLRYAVRSMRHAPGFAIVAILCLAVGISVNTAAFSVLNAVMFRDFPGVVRQQELASVLIGQETKWGRSSPEYASVVDWETLRSGMSAFSGIAAFNNLQLSVRVGVGTEPQAVRGDLVSNNFFDVLGTRPAAGRFMTARDDLRDLERVVVISHGYWKRTFDARLDIVGQVVTIGTRVFTIIGVAPEGFFGLYAGEVVDPDIGAPQVFIPVEAAPFLRARSPATTSAASLDDRWLQVFGRLRPGVTLAEAEAQANGVAARLAAEYPVARKRAFAVLRAGGDRAKDVAEAISAMLFVMAVPAIILLVACANLANQLLARAIERGREIAMRLSLGATRARVMRQLLIETALLAIVASGVGVVLARWLLDALRVWFVAIPFRIAIDARVLAFTIGLAVVTALAFGLAPALRATRTDLASALKDGPSGGYRRSRLRNGLVVAQIAASLALIAVSSVFVQATQRPPSGLDAIANRALLVSVNLDLLGFDSVAGRAYQTLVLERLGHLPGVAAAGMAPFAMFDMLGGEPVTQPGQDASNPRYFDLAEVSGAWFDATNTRPVRGRLFSAAERAGPPAVAIVDEVFARRFFGATDAIGRTLRIGADSAATVVTVVGVVPERQEVAFRQAEGVVFIPGTRHYNPRTYFYVRTNADADPMIAAVRQVVAVVDTRVPILWVRTLDDVAAREVAEMTMLASGLRSLGTVALALAALGLFGVLSFIVARRRYEIGIRVALGAQRIDVTWMVLRQALGLGTWGVVVGALIALVAVALLRAVIHGLQPLDLLAFGAMSVTMVLVALIASAVPARRAASVDPMTALRAD
jgi:predicted permease